MTRFGTTILLLACLSIAACQTPEDATRDVPQPVDPLPSWRDTASRQRILEFVKQVSTRTSGAYVEARDRIAVVDNDGTLWCEKPTYIQFDFIISLLRQQAERDASLATVQPYKAAREGDHAYFAALDHKGLFELLTTAQSGMTHEQFDRDVRAFTSGWSHPKYRKRCTQLTYQPMLELLALLRSNGFRIYIVTGGSTEFVRTISEETYKVDRANVVGTTQATRYELQGERVVLMRETALVGPVNDGPGKPVNLWQRIGRRPLVAIGNSDGDLEMMRMAHEPSRQSLAILVHHDDAEREYAYDKGAEKVLAAARKNDWVVIDMKREWTRVFSFDSR